MSRKGRRVYGAKRPPDKERFVKLPHYMLGCPAWRALSSNGKVAYIELLARYNGVNNGSVALSTRDLAKRMDVSNDTAARALKEVVAHGFAEITVDSNFNRKVGAAREFRLTAVNDNRPGMPDRSTKDFMSWSPVDAAKNQKPVAPVGRTDAPVVPNAAIVELKVG